MWAIDELLKHKITNLTTLCAVSLNTLERYHYASLLKVLQRHAIDLLAGYENEMLYLVSFTGGIDPMGDAKSLLAELDQQG